MIGRAFLMGAAAALLSCAPAPRLPDADLTDAQGWIFMTHLNMAAFAAPDPRDYAIIVTCEGEALRFYHRTVRPEELDGAPSLTLQSGRQVLTLPGERQDERATPPPVAMSGEGELTGVTISAVVARNAPVVENFLRTGDLELRSGRRITQADAAPNEAAALRAMWQRCA